MAAELNKAFQIESELIEGSGGIFEVEIDGQVIFDKAQTDRFPHVGEVSSLIEAS